MAIVLTDSSNYTNIANSIRAKNGTTNTYKPSEMSDAILAIQVENDTSDATATASDIASGKTAYVNRNKITGTLDEISTGVFQLNVSTPRNYASDLFVVSDTVGKDRILRDGVEIRIPMGRSSFGNATAEDVANGKTFTSSSGYASIGTAIHPTVIEEISVAAQENISAGDTVYVESNSNAYLALSGNVSLVSGSTISIGYAPSTIAMGESGTVKVIATVTCS